MDEMILKEKQKYEKIWEKDPYRIFSPGFDSVSSFLTQMKEKLSPTDSLIDFGCGTGIVSIPFLEKGLKVSLVDIAENCLDEKIKVFSHLHPEMLSFTQASIWDLPSSIEISDWIYCVDVLEHLPTEKVTSSLRSMAQKTKKGGALQVCLVDDKMGQLIGETLHLTVKPLDWWLSQISLFWNIEEVKELIPQVYYCIYVGTPKP